MKIYEFTNYIEFLQEMIHANANVRGYKSKLAESANCQRSYFSLVLRGGAHITFEQAFHFSNFLGLDSEECEYFMDLVHLARAGTQELKKFYEKKLQSFRSKKEDLTHRFTAGFNPDEQLASLYYSSWHWSALHILCGIKEFQTIKAMSKKLRLSERFIEDSLKQLQQQGFVESLDGKVWKNAKKETHLSRNSYFTTLNHSNWRQKALLDSQERDVESIHYTAVHSLSKEDVKKLKRMILNFFEQTREVVKPSAPEELVCFATDFFVVK